MTLAGQAQLQHVRAQTAATRGCDGEEIAQTTEQGAAAALGFT